MKTPVDFLDLFQSSVRSHCYSTVWGDFIYDLWNCIRSFLVFLLLLWLFCWWYSAVLVLHTTTKKERKSIFFLDCELVFLLDNLWDLLFHKLRQVGLKWFIQSSVTEVNVMCWSNQWRHNSYATRAVRNPWLLGKRSYQFLGSNQNALAEQTWIV